MNIVIDTNVLLSAVLWTGTPHDVLKIILEKYSLVQSQATLNEFEKVLKRDKFRKILEKQGLIVESVVETLIRQSKFYTISDKSESIANRIIIRDTDDLIFIQLALESRAKFIVSGDSHLLDLKKVDNIQILDVNEFLRTCD